LAGRKKVTNYKIDYPDRLFLKHFALNLRPGVSNEVVQQNSSYKEYNNLKLLCRKCAMAFPPTPDL
jgi:hypothetical protein